MERRAWLLLWVPALLGVAVYAASFDNGFRADDYPFLAAVAGADSPRALLAPQPDIAFYRPLALALFALEYRVFGLAGGAYLAFNALLQAGLAGLGLALLRRLGLDPRAAALAAGCFFLGVFHYGKQVTWACTSGGLLGLGLLLAALLLAEAPVPAARARSFPRVMALLLIALLAPFAHEAGLLIGPLVLLRLLLAGGSSRARAGWLGALLFVPALALWIWATQAAGVDTARSSLAGGLAAALPRWLRYFGLAVLPLQVEAVPRAAGAPLGLAQLVLGALVTALCAARLAARRAPPGQRFLAAWALLALLPYALVPLPSAWLELRYLHGAALPLAGLGACALAAAPPGWRRRTASAAAAAFVVAALAIGLVLERKYDREAQNPENRERLAAIVALRQAPR